jgi:predicted nuclease of restriction endonuclease-like (RecB) superfamily
MANKISNLDGYGEFLKGLKEKIAQAQVKAALAVSHELVKLYWHIGREILQQQQAKGWGAQVIDRLSRDLKIAFPGQEGFSPRNLKYMRKFAEIWPDPEIVQQAVAQLPWGHQTVLMDKLDSAESRIWYIQMAITHGWSRNILTHQIETALMDRQGRAPTNFQQTLPSPQSDLAHQVLKDPYNLEFLTLYEDAKERDLEKALIQNIRDFLLELGSGFAFVGQQFHLEVGGDDFYPDLLFYHLKLRCYVVIDLKMRNFVPEYAGKMNFYVSVVEDKLRDKEHDNPTIGLILCKSKNNQVAEYALNGITRPIGVASYELPPAVKQALAVDEIKQHLSELDVKYEPNE